MKKSLLFLIVFAVLGCNQAAPALKQVQITKLQAVINNLRKVRSELSALNVNIPINSKIIIFQKSEIMVDRTIEFFKLIENGSKDANLLANKCQEVRNSFEDKDIRPFTNSSKLSDAFIKINDTFQDISKAFQDKSKPKPEKEDITRHFDNAIQKARAAATAFTAASTDGETLFTVTSRLNPGRENWNRNAFKAMVKSLSNSFTLIADALDDTKDDLTNN